MAARLEVFMDGDDEAQVVIRKAREGDAARIIAYLQKLAEEPDINVPVAPGEFNMSVEEEEEFIRKHDETDNSVLIVAEAAGELIGVMNISGGQRKAMRHAGRLGISVQRDWRGRGVGSKMLRYAMDWAKGTGILTRVDLQVYERNVEAIRLYERFGFRHEGLHPRAFYQHGEYLDEVTMGLLIEL